MHALEENSTLETNDIEKGINFTYLSKDISLRIHRNQALFTHSKLPMCLCTDANLPMKFTKTKEGFIGTSKQYVFNKNGKNTLIDNLIYYTNVSNPKIQFESEDNILCDSHRSTYMKNIYYEQNSNFLSRLYNLIFRFTTEASVRHPSIFHLENKENLSDSKTYNFDRDCTILCGFNSKIVDIKFKGINSNVKMEFLSSKKDNTLIIFFYKKRTRSI